MTRKQIPVAGTHTDSWCSATRDAEARTGSNVLCDEIVSAYVRRSTAARKRQGLSRGVEEVDTLARLGRLMSTSSARSAPRAGRSDSPDRVTHAQRVEHARPA